MMQNTPHPVPVLATIGGLVTSFAGAVGQTASDAINQVSPVGGVPLGTTAAWTGAIVTAIGAAIQGWLMFVDAQRKKKVADREADLDFDTKEQATWGPKYEAELDRRISAEARLKVAEEKLAEMRSELDTFKHTAKAAVKRVNEKAETAIAKADAVADRVTSVESVQSGLSGDNLPTSPGMRGDA